MGKKSFLLELYLSARNAGLPLRFCGKNAISNVLRVLCFGQEYSKGATIFFNHKINVWKTRAPSNPKEKCDLEIERNLL